MTPTASKRILCAAGAANRNRCVTIGEDGDDLPLVSVLPRSQKVSVDHAFFTLDYAGRYSVSEVRRPFGVW